MPTGQRVSKLERALQTQVNTPAAALENTSEIPTACSEVLNKKKKAGGGTLSGILGSEAQERLCSLWSGPQRLKPKENPKEKFLPLLLRNCFPAQQSDRVQDNQEQMQAGTNLTYTQPNKQGCCRSPVLATHPEIAFSVPVQWAGQQGAQGMVALSLKTSQAAMKRNQLH